jgi:hypothetical protein
METAAPVPVARRYPGMGEQPQKDDVLLALALAADHPSERRVHPDRRSGLDRRKRMVETKSERRSGEERRGHARRKGETSPSGLLARALESLSLRARQRQSLDTGRA